LYVAGPCRPEHPGDVAATGAREDSQSPRALAIGRPVPPEEQVILRRIPPLLLGRPDPEVQVGRPEHLAVLQRQARRVDVDRCVETAMELAALRQSVEQFVSPRLVASMAREHWLNLVSES